MVVAMINQGSRPNLLGFWMADIQTQKTRLGGGGLIERKYADRDSNPGPIGYKSLRLNDL